MNQTIGKHQFYLMKTAHYRLLLLLFIPFQLSGTLSAQTPQYINYQAAVRNSSGELISDAAVTILVSILNESATGEVLYSETHSTGTTSHGLINLHIGSGTIEEVDFTAIDWSNDKKFLKVELKQGSSAFTVMGTQQLVSVPYALQAENAQAIAGRKVAATAPATGKVLKWNGTAWAPAADANTTAPAGAAGGDLSGTYPNPAIGADKVTTAKVANAAITTEKIADAAVTDNKLAANAVTSAKIANGAVTAVKLHPMGATNGKVLKYNGTAWAPATDNNTVGWGLNGNVVTANNFIGTTSAQPLTIKVNNQLSGRMAHSSTNTSFGYNSLQNTTSTASTAFGLRALYANSSGLYNIAMGVYTMESNTSGGNNIAIGYNALFNNTNKSYNVAIGSYSLQYNTQGEANTAVGYKALNYNETGLYNTAVGYHALQANNSGNGNVGVGYHTLPVNTSGHGNTAVGNFSLYNNTSGYSNTAVGYSAFQNATIFHHSTALGYGTNITASNQMRFGTGSITSIGGYTNWTNVSDARFKKNIQENVPGLDFIKKLRPVTYHLDMDAIARHQHLPDSLRLKEAEALKEEEWQTGFIAQEVEQAALVSGYDFSGVDKPKSEDDYYGLRYAEFVVPLVKAVQELSKENEELKIRITQLERQAIPKE